MSGEIPYQPEPSAENIEKRLEELTSPEIRDFLVAYIFNMRKDFSSAEVDDIVQDSMLKATQAIQAGKFNGSRAKLSTWLNTIGENTAKDLLRRKKFRNLNDSLSEDHNLPSSEQNSQDRLIAAERDKNLVSYIKELPPEQREVFELVKAGLELKEIATNKGISINTVKSRKRYALEYLKKRVRQEEK